MYAINLNINQNRLNYNAELFGDPQSAYILQPLHAYIITIGRNTPVL